MKLSVSAIDKMKVAELKEKCREFGLKQSGKKAEIQERLRDYLKNEAKKKKNRSSGQYKKEKRKYDEIMESLEGLRVSDLKAMLERNNVIKGGNKKELLERVADCKLYGTYPGCKSCDGGRLKVTYDDKFGHGGQGMWYCNGYMDDDEFIRCGFRSNEEMKRPKWKD